MTDVFIDERFAGKVDDPRAFLVNFKAERAKGKLPGSVNVFYNEELDELNVEISRGRVRRPLIVVENGKSRLTQYIYEQLEKKEITWKDLITKGAVEYLDASEEENALVALNEKDLTEEHT